MKANRNILFLIIFLFCTLLNSSYLLCARYNNIYLEKNKIYPKLVTTFSGEYISINEIISKILVDFKRYDKYTIANQSSKISFIPSAIFVKFSNIEEDKIAQLYKPIIRLGNKDDEIYISIEDLPVILNNFNLFSAKELNKDLIINKNIIRTIKPKAMPDKKKLSILAEEVRKNKISTKDSITTKVKENFPKELKKSILDTQKIVPNSYRIPEDLIRRNIKK